ncbi:MAG: hypothetical protein ACE5KM_17705, partial [Planctomycetaceae bacterium]
MFPSRSPARLIVLMGWAVVSFPDSPGARPAGADDRDFARVSQRRMMGDDAGTDAPVAGTTDPPGGK